MGAADRCGGAIYADGGARLDEVSERVGWAGGAYEGRVVAICSCERLGCEVGTQREYAVNYFVR